jgi:periplasmic divalent cation tolerance protein
VSEAEPDLTCAVVLCTVPNADVGDALARGMVDARVAACVNRIGPIRSTYRWDGEVHAHEEHQLVIKTTADALPQLRELVRAAHPYEVPELIVLEGTILDAPYARWLRGQVD